jgi:predicted dehydrogenase
MRPLNFIIIGCGHIAQRHALQIAKHGQLVAVCDVVKTKADLFSEQYNATPYYDIDVLLSLEKNIEWAIICTPNGLHAAHSIKALQAGCNVLCEKPLCINISDGEAMLNAAQKAARHLFVVKQNRYNPPVQLVKQLLDKQLLGKIFSFQLNCFWNRPAAYYTNWKGTKQLDGGVLFTQFSHFIDLLYWMLGDVLKVHAVIKNCNHPQIEIDDSGVVLLEMQNGSTGALNYSVNSFEKNMEGSFTLIGEKGAVKIGGQYLNELEYCNVHNFEAPVLEKGNEANSYGFYQGSMSNHDKVYEHLSGADSTSTALASAADGVKTVEIINRIYTASQ